MVVRLSRGAECSITELAEGMPVTRQAVSKHLRVLEEAGLVRCSQYGRERRFVLEAKAVRKMSEFLERVSERWDERLARLKVMVEA
jgi:DNA-binding transcriptional ArsR family regulator